MVEILGAPAEAGAYCKCPVAQIGEHHLFQ